MSSLADLLETVDHISLNDKNRVVCSITGENDHDDNEELDTRPLIT